MRWLTLLVLILGSRAFANSSVEADSDLVDRYGHSENVTAEDFVHLRLRVEAFQDLRARVTSTPLPIEGFETNPLFDVYFVPGAITAAFVDGRFSVRRMDRTPIEIRLSNRVRYFMRSERVNQITQAQHHYFNNVRRQRGLKPLGPRPRFSSGQLALAFMEIQPSFNTALGLEGQIARPELMWTLAIPQATFENPTKGTAFELDFKFHLLPRDRMKSIRLEARYFGTIEIIPPADTSRDRVARWLLLSCENDLTRQ